MRKVTVVAVLFAAVTFALVTGCSKEKAGAAVPGPVVKGVGVEQITSGEIPDVIEAVGSVRARNIAIISARIPGTVTAVVVREGERVSRGKVLATLMANESLAGAAGAEAGVEEAKRALDEAVARQKLATSTFARYSNLLREQAVTQQEFDSRLMEKEVADQGVARAKARLAQAQETHRASETVAGYTRITSPLTGIVTGKSIDMGMTVFPGMQLMTVEDDSVYRLEVMAPATLLGKIKVGDKVAVSLSGIPELSGRVAEVIPSADPVSRTFPVKIDVTAPFLRSGMYGSAYFSIGEKMGILISRGAVVERGSLTSVWVVGTDTIARMRLVKLGKAVGDKIEVISGLAEGERIVVSGTQLVTDGARIQ
jgi:RND family efflux transporter MFP subunit